MSFITEELGHRLNRLRDEQARINSAIEARLQSLQAENTEIRNRLMVLTRLLIARQIATAEEIATALAAASATPAVETDARPVETASDQAGHDQADKSDDGPREQTMEAS